MANSPLLSSRGLLLVLAPLVVLASFPAAAETSAPFCWVAPHQSCPLSQPCYRNEQYHTNKDHPCSFVHKASTSTPLGRITEAKITKKPEHGLLFSHGKYQENGQEFLYKPNKGFVGEDHFSIHIEYINKVDVPSTMDFDITMSVLDDQQY